MKRLRIYCGFIASLLVALLPFSGLSAFCHSYDVAQDFSSTNNPNDVWSYGSVSSLVAPLDLFGNLTTFVAGGTVDYVYGSGGIYPAVFHNGSALPYDSGDPGPGLVPGQLAIHAGENLFGVVQWIAPETATYLVDSLFYGVTDDSTNVHVTLNGAVLFSAAHDGQFDADTFIQLLPLSQGDVLRFAVEHRDNFQYEYVGLDTVISVIPEPSTLNIFGFMTWLSLCFSRVRR